MWGTSSEAAYGAFLEGKYGFNLSSREALDESRRWFERATQMDPSFARAWAALSYAHVQAWLHGWGAEADLEEAARLARRAVELDPADYFTRWHLAFYLLNVRRFDEALAEYEAALALSDESQDLLVEMAEALICAGRMEDGIKLIERARQTADWDRWDTAWRRCLSTGGQPSNYHEALALVSRMHRKPGDPRGLIDVQLLTAAMLGGEASPKANGAPAHVNGKTNGANGHSHAVNGAANGAGANGSGDAEANGSAVMPRPKEPGILMPNLRGERAGR
jgi:tetratricopeptide (TPR) repeat protein